MNPKFKFIFLSVLFCCLSISLYSQTTTIEGKLIGSDGKPSAYALVGICTTISDNAKDFVKCDSEGNYSITITKPGPVTLLFSIPNHEALRIPIYNKADRNFSLDVRLAYYKYVNDLDNVMVLGDFNDMQISSAEQMKKEADGTFNYIVKSPLKEMRYQIYKAEESGRSINGTESTNFEPDSSGDYRSIIPVKDGTAKIIFDPSKLLKGGSEQKVVFSGSTFDGQYFDLSRKYTKYFDDANKELQKWVDAKKSPMYFQYDSGNFIPELTALIESEKDPEIKKYASLIYSTFSAYRPVGYSLEKATQWYESIAPSDPVWDMVPSAVSLCYILFPFKANEILDRFLKESKSLSIKENILTIKLSGAKYMGNTAELKKLHEQIKKDYADIKELQNLLDRFPIESNIKVGAEIPEFEAASLDNPAEKISKKNMLGKIYMIDFWATWCGPCVGEMDGLHKAFEKYKEKGFEIISLSMDASPGDILKFRKAKFPMPWKHAFINNTEGKKISKSFEVTGIPKPILVSSTGVILAMTDDLRGNKLDETLAKYFGEVKAGK